MNPSPQSTPTDTSRLAVRDRLQRLALLVEDVVRRRSGGEPLSDDAVIQAHPDLMPELGQNLRALDRVEEAHCEAKSRSAAADASASHSGTSPDGLASPSADSFAGFELVGEAHHGGQGVVYRAIQKSTNRDVAIKVMHEGPFAGSRGQARFDREVRILAKLKHPNIVTIHDSGTAAGSHYFVMDWIAGLPLDTYMASGRGRIDDTLRANIALAEALNDRGSLEEADRLFKQTLDTCLRVFTEEHEVTLAAAKARATFLWPLRRLEEASQLAYRTHSICSRLYGDGDARTLAALNLWASFGLYGAERQATMEPLLRATLARTKEVLGDDHVEVYLAMANLGAVLRDQRRLSEAESLLREAYEGLREILGEDHFTVLTVAWNFAILLRERGLVDESRRLSQEAVELSRRRLGENHPLSKNLAYHLATAFFRDGRYADAIALLDGILQTSDLNSSHESATTARTLGAYGYSLNKLGRYAEAETRIRAALNLLLELSGGYNPVHAWCLWRLTEALEGQNKEEQARSFAEKRLELRYQAAHHPNADAYALNCYARALLTAFPNDLRDPPRALEFALLAHERSTDEYHYNRFTLARAFEANGDLEQALYFGRRALDSAPIEHSTERQEYEGLLVRLLERTGNLEKAEQVYRSTLEARRDQFPEGDGAIAMALFDLGSFLLEHGKPDEAQDHLQECLAIRKALLDESGGDRHTRSLECDSAWTSTRLGQCLLEQSRYEEAEAALLEAHSRLATLTGCHADWLAETRRFLVRLQQGWGKPMEAAPLCNRQSGSPIVRPSD